MIITGSQRTLYDLVALRVAYEQKGTMEGAPRRGNFFLLLRALFLYIRTVEKMLCLSLKALINFAACY